MNKNVMCWYDEAFTINEMLEETSRCLKCKHKECPNCGADMRPEPPKEER